MKKGKKLEEIVAEKLKELGDKYARPTKASGASTEIGDVYSDWFYVEAKERKNLKNAVILKDAWEKLLKDIPIHKAHEKPPLYIVQNKSNDIFVCMLINDFIKLLKEE